MRGMVEKRDLPKKATKFTTSGRTPGSDLRAEGTSEGSSEEPPTETHTEIDAPKSTDHGPWGARNTAPSRRTLLRPSTKETTPKDHSRAGGLWKPMEEDDPGPPAPKS